MTLLSRHDNYMKSPVSRPPEPLAGSSIAASGLTWCQSSTFGRSSAVAVRELHRDQASNCDGEIEWPDNRLQIGKAAREQIERHDVA